MIACQFDDRIHSATIVLRPNNSWTWRANVYFVASLMIISMTIAATFAYRGFWLVLPFTLVELTALLYCLYYCVRRTHTTEVLILSERVLVFERGIRQPRLRRSLDRYFSRFFVEAPSHPWYRKKIELRCRDEQWEVGGFLSSPEKDELVKHLRDAIHWLDSLPPPSAAARQ